MVLEVKASAAYQARLAARLFIDKYPDAARELSSWSLGHLCGTAHCVLGDKCNRALLRMVGMFTVLGNYPFSMKNYPRRNAAVVWSRLAYAGQEKVANYALYPILLFYITYRPRSVPQTCINTAQYDHRNANNCSLTCMQLTLRLFVTVGAVEGATPHRNNYNGIRNRSLPDCIVPKNEEKIAAYITCNTAISRGCQMLGSWLRSTEDLQDAGCP